MRTFLIISVGLLAIALAIVITVFLYLSFKVMPARESSNSAPLVEPSLTLPAQPSGTTTPSTTNAVAPIPLRDVPLSAAQRSALDTVGVDSDTFVITPEIQRCAEEKIGQTRVSEITGGDTPSAIETAKLLTCL